VKEKQKNSRRTKFVARRGATSRKLTRDVASASRVASRLFFVAGLWPRFCARRATRGVARRACF